MREYQPRHYRFQRMAERMHRLDTLQFEDSPAPLRPIVRLRWVMLAMVLLTLVAIHWS